MNVLNAGYVNLVESMGGDYSVIRNARLCWRSKSKGEESDRRLIKHLLNAGHMTPFESMIFTFSVKAPIFVTRQWMRHRIGTFAEESLRHCTPEPDYYEPENLRGIMGKSAWMWNNTIGIALETYRDCVNSGMPKEQARAILPTALYTRFYWTVNGSSLKNFLRLRSDKHAQTEIRAYAEAIRHLVKFVAPVTFGEVE